MAGNLTRDETIRAVAEVIAGLQVPVSIAMPLGTAREPWGKLHHLIGGGWYDADRAEVALREVLDAEATTRLVETGSYIMDKGRWKWVRRGVLHDLSK